MKHRQKPRTVPKAAQKPNRPANKKGAASQLRIIGGQWRSRRLPVASVPGLRPTPDRVRETLFNWLQQQVPGARCLDLFAGSGALGFEALSREAAEVVLVEKHAAAFAQLQVNAGILQAIRAELVNRDALDYLMTQPQPFDLIFLDPPFRKGFIDQVMALILGQGLLKTDGLIYLEYEAGLIPDFSQWGMQPRRETTAGQVVSVLLQPAE
jgi:16S rRNA (guanine966-N2)-methyltransferase